MRRVERQKAESSMCLDLLHFLNGTDMVCSSQEQMDRTKASACHCRCIGHGQHCTARNWCWSKARQLGKQHPSKETTSFVWRHMGNSTPASNQVPFRSMELKREPTWNVPNFMWFSATFLHIIRIIQQTTMTTQQQQQHSLFSQASWNRLEMKPERNKFKVQAHW